MLNLFKKFLLPVGLFIVGAAIAAVALSFLVELSLALYMSVGIGLAVTGLGMLVRHLVQARSELSELDVEDVPDLYQPLPNGFADNIGTANELDLLNQPVASIPRDLLFVSESGYRFDVRQLLQSFDLKGLVNPYTGEVLSKGDIERLQQHKTYGKRFAAVVHTFEKVRGMTTTANPNIKLKHVYVTSSNKLLDMYAPENSVANLAKQYLNGLLKRDDLIGAVRCVFDNIQEDIELKRTLTEMQEKDLKDNAIFHSLVCAKAVDMSLEKLSKDEFWQLMKREQRILSDKYPGTLREAGLMLEALEAFDRNPESYVRTAGHSGTIRYGSEYIVRVDEICGYDKGVAALKSIINTFKGAFVAVLRHDRFKDMFDRMDKGGICVAERTRNVAALAGTLDSQSPDETNRTLLELLGDYQAELTGSSESKSHFYENSDAVDFILRRHKDEKFVYQDRDGNKKVGIIDKDIITYYLKTYICHDGLPDVTPHPAFQTI